MTKDRIGASIRSLSHPCLIFGAICRINKGKGAKRVKRQLYRLTLGALLCALCLCRPALAAESEGYIVRLGTPPRLFSALSTRAAPPAVLPELEEVCASEGVYVVEDGDGVRALEEAGLLVYAEPNYIVTLFDAPDDLPDDAPIDIPDDAPDDAQDELFSEWWLSVLGMDYCREHGIDGAGVRVGVVDTGLNAAHEDFAETEIVSGKNYIRDADPQDTSDSNGHGTFVSGLIAASTDNGVGIDGMAPAVELVPLKCFEGRTTTVAAIGRAIRGGVDEYRCQVLNLCSTSARLTVKGLEARMFFVVL